MDLYDLRLTEKFFYLWCEAQSVLKMIEDRKIMQAEAHYNWYNTYNNNAIRNLINIFMIFLRQLKWKGLEHWQRLHIILKIEKETEERRQRWRVKIWELLPDYEPRQELN